MSEPKSVGPQDGLKTLYQKIHAVKAEMGAVLKNSKNPFFKSNYADLNEHLNMIEPLLTKHNLVLTQGTVAAGGALGNVVESKITNAEPFAQVSASLALPALDDMQKLGGAITYARRYTLSALLGMKAEDDDGNSASGKKTAKRAKASTSAGSDF